MDGQKRTKIKETLRATRERRQTQVPRVYQLKLQNLSKKDVETLNRLFLEAKWLYNWMVADVKNRLTDSAWKVKTVQIKTPDGFEEREITTLGSQVRQSIVSRVEDALKALKKAKEKGIKVGALSFKSEVRSIPLKQYGVTYKLDFEKNRLRIQGVKKKFRVLGLHQIPNRAEIANAYLIKKPSGFYLHVVCYLDRECVKQEIKARQTLEPVGIDLGIEHQITLSTGEKIDWCVPETKRLKKLQRQLARKKKRSRRYRRTVQLIRKEWEYICNIRKDVLNKVVSYLKQFSLIAVQADSVKGWHEGLFGKQVQHTGIGGITAKLKRLATLVPVVFVDRRAPTTRICSICGHVNAISLGKRTFKCPVCGTKLDRDLNAARNILKLALGGLADPVKSALPVDCGEVTPVERIAPALTLGNNPYVSVSCLVEAGSSSL